MHSSDYGANLRGRRAACRICKLGNLYACFCGLQLLIIGHENIKIIKLRFACSLLRLRVLWNGGRDDF